MTLEDFFTLTEMRDGLWSLSRVEDLLSVIQNLNDCATSNLSDAVRQWSTVASVLTATDHKECLNKFLELNGLSFLNKWLQEALNLSADVSDTIREELIHSLLTSFERLPIDYKRITASGIGVTIGLLLDHKSIPIKEKARILYDKWNLARNDDVSCGDQDKSVVSESNQPGPCENVQTSENCMNLVNPVTDVSPFSVGTGEGKCEMESAGPEFQVSNDAGCLDSSPLDYTNKEIVPTSNQVLSTSSTPINSNAVLADVNSLGSALVSNSCQEKISVTDESSVCVAVGKPSTGSCSQFGRGGVADEQQDASMSKDVPDSVKKMDVDMKEGETCKSNQRESSSNYSSFTFSASMAPLVAAGEPTISCKLDSSIGDSFASKGTEHQPKAGAFDYERGKSVIISKESNPAASITSGFQDPSCTASILSNTGDPNFSRQKEEAISTVVKEHDCGVNFKRRKARFSTSSDFLKAVGTKANEEFRQKPGLGLECVDDALEVARQVARAVEREVVDYREPFCSSPDVDSGETTGSHNLDSEEEKQDQPLTEEVGGDSSSSGKEHSGTSSPDKESEITQNISSNPENSDQDVESLEPKIPAQETVGKSIMDGCTLDLNTNICSDEPECLMKPILKMPINVSAPVAVVASSKGSPGLPVTPLRFEGEMGWKGSAATSAFRPASPRRTPDGERTCSGPKQKSNFLEIDLNVTERVDEEADEPSSGKQFPASSSLPSGDSCVEVSSRTEKLNLDLNRLGDEDVSTYPFSSWKLHFQSGERSMSSASSSSYRQSSLRDFDLNDNLSVPEIGGSHNFDNLSAKDSDSHGPAPHDPVIKIMGSKIAVERKDNTNQVQQSFLINGLSMEPSLIARPLLPSANIPNPAYGYAGLPTGPTMSVPAAYYLPGSISYMVDSRGAAVMPHVTGSGLVLPTTRPPFLLGATSIPSNAAGFGSPRPGFDLNSGITPVEGGIREGGSFEQFFMQGHRGWMEDQTKTAAQPSSSSAVTLKRKEPDSGWEPTLFGYKQMTSRQ